MIANTTCIARFETDFTTFAPQRPPTVSHLPVANASTHNQSVVIFLVSTSIEDASAILPPVSSINLNDSWPRLEPCLQIWAAMITERISYFKILLLSKSVALSWFCLKDRTDIRVVLIPRYPIVLEVLVDIVRTILIPTSLTAIDNFLLSQRDPFSSPLSLPQPLHLKIHFFIDLKFHQPNNREDMSPIIIPHILNRRKVLRPIIVVIILKLRNLPILFLPSNCSDYGVQLLKLLLCQVVLIVQTLFVRVVQFLLVEYQVIVGLVESVFAV